MVEKNSIFKLFACCIPVLGARRSTICDLQRQTFFLIPNSLCEILKEYQSKTVEEIESIYGGEYNVEIEEYFQFLIENELGFWCDNPDLFPDLDLAWKTPERITNAIIDVTSESFHDFAKIYCELNDLGCKHLQIRFYETVSLDELEGVLAHSKLGRLRSIDLVVRYSSEMTIANLERMSSSHGRISSVVVHSSPTDKSVGFPNSVPLIFRRQVIDSPKCCGEIHPAYFVTNLQCFSEAQAYNTCLNRKISVDARGEIKNCPSMTKSFGNIHKVSLHEALAQRDFKDLWAINKDQVAVCKDCEFRYICTDCRAYVSEPADHYSKPSKCTYDPYTAQWIE